MGWVAGACLELCFSFFLLCAGFEALELMLPQALVDLHPVVRGSEFVGVEALHAGTSFRTRLMSLGAAAGARKLGM
jgi:hypothetical protein